MENSIKYPIKAVANLTGLSIHVIRAWEKRYSAVVPRRTDTNRRLYSNEDVEKLKLLSKASEMGYSIGNIASYNIDDLVKIVGDEKATEQFEPDAIEEDNSSDSNHEYFKNCIDAIIDLNVQDLERELYRALVDMTQPVFLKNLVAPLLQEIGEMWQSGRIRIINEHISTAVIRKILNALIDNNNIPHNAPTIVIATPRGQMHELGALMVGVLASADGWKVMYMGPDLPGEEIVAAVERLKPKIVALSIVYPSDDFTLDNEMRKLNNLLGRKYKIIAGGRSAYDYKDDLDKMNAKIIVDLDEFREELAKSR